jgi:hypothetical protein
MRYVGGVNYPTMFGRGNATWTLGALTLDEEGLSLRIGIGCFAAVPLRAADRSAVEQVFPCRARLPFSPGLGIRLHDGKEFYFWATRATAGEILAELGRQGFPTSDKVRRALFVKSRR